MFVSDSVSRAVSPAERERLRAAVEAMAVPTRVAIISGPPGNLDVRGPNPSDLPLLLAGAVDRRGLYIVVDANDDAGSVHMSAVGARTRVAPDDIRRDVDHDVAPTSRVVDGDALSAFRLPSTPRRMRRRSCRSP